MEQSAECWIFYSVHILLYLVMDNVAENHLETIDMYNKQV